MVIKTKSDKAYDKRQLRMGTKVEMEHTTSRRKAKHIAKQHLEEIPKYYTYLNQLEKKHMKKPKKIKSKRNYKPKKRMSNKVKIGR